MMLTVNYITRPWFLDVAVEFINEFKHHVRLNVILIIAPQTASYLGINPEEAKKYLNKTLKIEDVLHGDNKERFYPYFKGANVFCKFEQHKESSFQNTLSWHKLLKENKNLASADFNVIETLSLADWYFLIRFRNKSLYYIMHDPVPHTGEERGRTAKINKLYFPYIKGFITYSKFASNLFKNYYPKYSSKLFTFSLPIYTSVNVKPHQDIVAKKNKVVFFGNSNEIDKILCYSDLFLLPSETESFGLAALEAMACGVPVISSNSGGLPEVNKDGFSGYLSDVGDIAKMSRDSISLLKDEDKLAQFKVNALATAKLFDIHNIVPLYEQVYLKAINSKK